VFVECSFKLHFLSSPKPQQLVGVKHERPIQWIYTPVEKFNRLANSHNVSKWVIFVLLSFDARSMQFSFGEWPNKSISRYSSSLLVSGALHSGFEHYGLFKAVCTARRAPFYRPDTSATIVSARDNQRTKH